MGSQGYVLIADDEPGIRALMATVLGDAGYSVREAADVSTALAVAGTERPIAAVLDYMMPGLSGVDLAVELRRLYGPELPLVFVSAIGIPQGELQRVDAYLFLNKPFDIDDLAQAVANAVREPAPHVLLTRRADHRREVPEIAQTS